MAKGETIYLKKDQVEIYRKMGSAKIDTIKVMKIFFSNESKKKDSNFSSFEKLKKATQLTVISEIENTVLYLRVKKFTFDKKNVSVTYTVL